MKALTTKKGTRAHLVQRIPQWDASILVQRLEDSRVLLLVHGYLRESESNRIKNKLAQDFERGM